MVSKKVTIIDDNADFCLLCKQALKIKGHVSEVFHDAQSAITHFHDSKDLPQLIFVDLSMPGMSGAEFIQALKADPQFQKLKVIVTSGWHDLKEKARSIGADGYLRKPFDLNQFYQMIDQSESSQNPN